MQLGFRVEGNISSARRRKSVNIGIILGGQYYCCHPLLVDDGPCLHLLGSELVTMQM